MRSSTPMRFKPLWWALALVLSGCEGDPALRKVAPTGFFDPLEIDFGVRNVGETYELGSKLGNTSGGRIQVQAVRFSPATNVFVARLADGGSVLGARIAPGARVDLVVRYGPRSIGVNDAVMTVVFERFEIDVPIRATAEELPPARPAIAPGQVDFQRVAVDAEAATRVMLTNDGSTEGVLRGVLARSPFAVRRIDGAPLSLPAEALAPGASLELDVVYAPQAAVRHDDVITFEFDNRARAQMQVIGQGVVAGTLECSPSSYDFEDVPRGDVIDQAVTCQTSGFYQLAEVRLAASSSPYFRLVGPAPQVDAAGQVTVNLQFMSVTLPQDHSATIEFVATHGAVTAVDFAARTVPPAPENTGIAVAMRWNTRNDFDLHLVRADGPLFSRDDCYYANKKPSWGLEADPLDNPHLDGDVVGGFGPELLNLMRPAEERFDIYVQFTIEAESPAPVASTVEVDVQLFGGALNTQVMVMATCGLMWHVGWVDRNGEDLRFTAVNEVLDRYVSFASCVDRGS